MKYFRIKILFLGIFFLPSNGLKAEGCYPLSSEEAASILANDVIEVRDNQFKWEVKHVGWGLTYLGLDNACNSGDFEVSEGIFYDGKCDYKITNVAEGDVAGESTQITLKRKAL